MTWPWSSSATTAELALVRSSTAGRGGRWGVGEPPRIGEEHGMKKIIGILAVVATVGLIGLAASKRRDS